MSRRTIGLLAAWASALAVSCANPSAGGSTDTETGALAGRALFTDDRPAARALVEAIRVDSGLAVLGPLAVAKAVVADDSGRWSLEGLAPGTWNLQLVEPGGKRALSSGRSVRVGTRDSSGQLLHTPARLQLRAAAGTKVWIVGTTLSADLVDGTGAIDSVPAGARLVVRTNRAASATLTLRPSQDTTLSLP